MSLTSTVGSVRWMASGLLLAMAAAAPVQAASVPTLDGQFDLAYLEHGVSIDYRGYVEGAEATLYFIDDTSVDPNYIWVAWVISLGFNDNSYGDPPNRHSSWPSGHGFEDLAESDRQRLQLVNTCSEDVLDANMDILDGPPPGTGGPYPTPSGYGVSMDASESIKIFINGGDWSLFEYGTSLASNLNDFGYCQNGDDCSVGGIDLYAESPLWADEPNYVPAAPYDDWEYRHIYELRIDRSVFVTGTCPQGGIEGVKSDPVELHASPSKPGVSPVSLFRVSASIGDFVWLDVDRDGVQDIGEPGITNVTVELWSDPDGDGDPSDGSLIGTTTTDSAGRYIFTRLGRGGYVVDVTDVNGVLAGLALTAGSTDPSAPIPLGAGDRYLDADFGYAPANVTLAAIGDYVWADADQDGLQDAGEPGIGGVTLDLIDLATGGPVDTTITALDGSYMFFDVAPGEYRVDVTDTFGVLAGYTLTVGPQSSPDPTLPIAVEPGDVYLQADFGYFRAGLGTVGNQLWLDASEDGLFTAGEEGLGSVSVVLIADADADGVWDAGEFIVATAKTGIAGTYGFNGLLVDDGGGDAAYLVVVTDIHDVVGEFLKVLGPSPGVDGNSQDEPYPVILTPGAPNEPSGDFGYWFDEPLALVGDRLWYDLDGDGVQDGNEPGIQGVTLELWHDKNKDGDIDNNERLLATGRTDLNGNYFFQRFDFDNNGEGYIVLVTDDDGLLVNYTQTGDPDPVLDGLGATVVSIADPVDLTLDFGYQPSGPFSIGDTVWEDLDADGVQDPGEPGFPQVTLALYEDADGDGVLDPGERLLANTETDGTGFYQFSGLVAGDYIVKVTDEMGVVAGYRLTSGLDEFPATLVAASRDDVDFGYVRNSTTGAIGDTVWMDLDGDGVEGSNEPGISGVTLELWDAGGDGQIGGGDDMLVGTRVTDGDGRYLFGGLLPGLYYVVVDESTLPGALVETSYPPGVDPGAVIAVSDGERFLEADFGYLPVAGTAIIGDRVWYDADGDGLQDPGEVGIEGVDIVVSGPSGLLTLTTGPNGLWLATGLPPGDYLATFDSATLPPDVDPTPTNNGGNTTYSVSLVAGSVFLHLDYGFNGGVRGSIGDTVYLDGNANGTQDPGEPGIAGVTLDLVSDPDGVPDSGDETVLATTTTTTTGLYDFQGLVAGNYRVVVTDIDGVLAGLSETQAAPAPIALAAGEDFDLADFGYAPSPGSGSVGNYVWHDLDGDGTAEPGESGIQGVTVDLWRDVDRDGTINPGIDNYLRTAVTDGNGEYFFLGLPISDYLVLVTDAAGVLDGFTKTDGPNDGQNNNSQDNPYSMPLSAAAPSDFTGDFGYQAAASLSISGTVFEDDDQSASFDEGVEGVVPGARLRLFRVVGGSEVLIGTTISDVNGDYLFSGLPPGDYVVEVDVKGTSVDGHLQTTQAATAGRQPVTLPDPGDPNDPPNSTDNDFGFWNGNLVTTPVTLAYFHAAGGGGSVRFKWLTATEVGNLGFNLYALEERDLRRLNDHLIPTRGGDSLHPQEYVFEAHGVGGELFLLEDVDLFGLPRFHGPFRLGEPAGREALAVERIDWPEIRRQHRHERQRRLAARAAAGPAGRPGAQAPPVRLLVDRDGIQRVTYEQLLAAGVDLAGVPASLLALSSGGEEVPVLVGGRGLFGPGAWIEFVGRALDTLYTGTNVYTLEVLPGGGRRVRLDGRPAPPGAQPPAAYREVAKVETNRAYHFAAPAGDPWYDRRLLAVSGPRQLLLDLDLEGYLAGAGPVDLELDLWGVTDFPRDPDHHLQVEVNGVLVADDWFNGLVHHPISVTLPDWLVQDEDNELRLLLPHDTGALADLVHYDHYRVSYPRRFLARQGRLSFTAAGEAFRVDGLPSSEVVVYRVSEDRVERLTRVAVGGLPGAYSATFAGGETPATYHVAATEALLQPGVEPARQPAEDLLSGPAELLIIAHPDFIDGIQPLAAARRARGLGVKVVDVEDLYARYSHGVFEPLAIRQYVQLAADRLGTGSVLLVGGDTYDYRDYLGLGSMSFIPTLFVQTDAIVRFAPVDPLYADVDLDGVPDLAVGRLPVRTPAELEAVVAKTLEYEGIANPRSAVLAADLFDIPSNYSFRDASEEMRALLPAPWRIARAYMDDLGLAGARQLLLDEIGAGVALTSYFGHSGLTVWSFQRLFEAADADDLANAGEPTVVTQWGCWNTYHVAPSYDTLGHKLLLAADRGAAAVLGAAALTEAASERKLGRLVFAHLARPGMTLGEAVLEAKRELAVTDPQLLDVLLGWTLLGDPTLIVQP